MPHHLSVEDIEFAQLLLPSPRYHLSVEDVEMVVSGGRCNVGLRPHGILVSTGVRAAVNGCNNSRCLDPRTRCDHDHRTD